MRHAGAKAKLKQAMQPYPPEISAGLSGERGWWEHRAVVAALVAVGLVVRSLLGGRPSRTPVSPDAPTTPVGSQWT